MKVVVLIDDGSIGSLNVAAIWPLIATPVARLAGSVALSVGAVASAMVPVVKLQTRSVASGLPARSVAAVVRVAV